jgi:glycosyltransferase involved in cell wall biosynthesis
VADVGLVLGSHRWDYVECISWANAATNLAVLAHRPPASRLLFTPHTQPLNTLQGFEQLHSVEPALTRMLQESDAIFIDSGTELDDYADRLGTPGRTHHVRLGVNDGLFHFEPVASRHQLVCLGDFAEARKRFDLVLAAFRLCLREDPSLTLAIAGNRSLDLEVPRDLEPSIVRHGYVELPVLVRLLRESRALLQLSDFEAFGLPIAEALCCGTPVIIPDQPTGRDVFGGLPGVTFVNRETLGDVAAALRRGPASPDERRNVAQQAGERFAFVNTYGLKLQIVRALRERTS